LKSIIGTANTQIFIVDPYFNGEAFDMYLSEVDPKVDLFILADRYSKDIQSYIDKHVAQYGTSIALRKSKELHDRIIFVDGEVSWIMGGFIKDAGKKATYLIPLASPITTAKFEIYKEIWGRAKEIIKNA